MKIRENFTLPKLCTRSGDITKDWFVYFYYTDPVSGVKRLFRYKLGLNRYKTKKEREKKGESIKNALYQKLQLNWNPITDEVQSDERNISVIGALEMAIRIKKAAMKESSYVTYNDHFKVLRSYLESHGIDQFYIHNIKTTHMQAYFDYLLVDRGQNGCTHNNYLATTHSLFATLVDRKIIESNPCTHIEKIREEKGKNTTYSVGEEKRFIEYCMNKDYYFYLATRFVKYCFLRRSELHHLQVKHILFDNKTIVIPSSISKSRVQDSITIPKTFEDIILKSSVLSCDPEMYVFGRGFKPNLVNIVNDETFTYKQKSINKELGIKSECTFYSWKHTGAVELYNLTKDPYIVMRQCRHADIKTTMRYLRSLGCGFSEQVREW